MSNVTTVLMDRLTALITAMGYEFVGCEFNRQDGDLCLRIYIDKPNNVTINDCTQVSRQVSAMLDVEPPVAGRYQLEVSSPGINRPLFTLAHYEKFIGHRVKVRLLSPIDGRVNFVGQLKCVQGTDIHLLMDALEVILPFANIAKANIVIDILPGDVKRRH